MKKTVSALFAAAMLLGATSGVSAANMGDKMMNMMQCSSACNVNYLQCVANANQLASTPQEGISQIATNFQGSTTCGQEAISCQASCNG